MCSIWNLNDFSVRRKTSNYTVDTHDTGLMSVTGDELGPNISTEGAPKCEAKDGSVSSSTESEEDDQESSSYALGYMPLSQDPDLDENDDDSCVETVTCLDITESPIKADSDTIIGPSRHAKPAEDHTHSPISLLEDSKNITIIIYSFISS